MSLLNDFQQGTSLNFKHLNTIFGITDDNDANRERSVEVTREMECCGLLQRTLQNISSLSRYSYYVKTVEIQKLPSPKFLIHENL
jgi:hypothetical protein